jgi:hypothetical protein
MPVVFVHGVNTRGGPDYDKAVADRNALFRNVFLPSAGLPDTTVDNPYWGGGGASFAFDLACVPSGRDRVVRLGQAGDASVAPLAAAAAAAADPPSADTVLLTLAQRDFVTAVDTLYAAAARTAADGGTDLAALAVAMSTYAVAHEDAPPAWLAEVSDDDGFVVRLRRELAGSTAPPPAATPAPAPAVETLGIASTTWNHVREGAARLGHEAGAFVGRPAWNLMRALLVPTVPTFLGDVLVYLARRGTAAQPGAIPAVVIDALRDAAARRTAQDPLVVVGHSLGGVVAADLLYGFVGDLPVDLLCTVGSQVALFEELKLLVASDPAVTASAGRATAKPAGVRHWLNVFDYNDVLSYKLEPVFTGAVDYAYPTGSLLRAHGAYFDQPSFHQRLGRRVREVFAG